MPSVPQAYPRKVFDSLHSLSYSRVRATECLLTTRYIYANIKADERKWAQACPQCQRAKVQRHTITALATLDTRFDIIHIDLVGPLPGYKIFTSVH